MCSVRTTPLFFEVDGMRVHVLRFHTFFHGKKTKTRGSTACRKNYPRPLVLLHGFGQNAKSWKGIAKRLAHRRSVYAVDLLGHGRSDGSESASDFSLEVQAAWLLALLRAIQDYENRRIDKCLRGLHGRAVGGIAAGKTMQSEAACGKIGHCGTTSAASAAGAEGLYDMVLSRSMLRDANAEGFTWNAASHVSKVDVLAYSYGGRLMLAAACCFPTELALLVGTLILESVRLGMRDEQERARFCKRDADGAETLRTQGAEAFFETWALQSVFESQRNLPAKKRKAQQHMRLANNAAFLAYALEKAGQHRMPLCEEVAASLQKLTKAGVRIAYLAGGLDEVYVRQADYFRNIFAFNEFAGSGDSWGDMHADAINIMMNKCAKDTDSGGDMHRNRCAIIPGAGHNIHLEQPAAFVRAVDSILA